MVITYDRVQTNKDLQEILRLQRTNLPAALSHSEQVSEGFVTVSHSLEILEQMNTRCPHIVAKHDGDVVGYALCMMESFRNDIPILIPMFQEIDSVIQKGSKYMVMGQICIDKSYRGKGIFRGLYEYMASELRANFDVIITEVDVTNTRSSQAHRSVGFKVLKTYHANDRNWELIGLEI